VKFRLRHLGLILAILLVASACGSSSPKSATSKPSGSTGSVAPNTENIASLTPVSSAPEAGDYLVLYNPQVVAMAGESEKGEEGSVSLPGIRVEIDRPIWVEVAFMDADGAARTTRFERFAARVALHEIEQMQGIFFLQRLSRLKRERALKKAKKLSG